jgi:thiol-disulfide isomerase/thioredoxin
MRTPSLLLACLLLAAPAAADEPFVDLGYDAAVTKAKVDGKLLLLDFTATWCPPCKQMEKVTWPAKEVAAWLGAHALALQVDVDEDRELAQRFGIESIPTLVFLKDGVEVDRRTGFQDAAKLVAWGDAVRAGRSSAKESAEKGRALRESPDVDARYEAAREALQRREDELALEHYLWLWPKTREVSSYGGVRLSFMLADMARLAERHEPAREAFLALREELQARVDAAAVPTFEDWQEWSSMAEYFGEVQRVITWYEARRDAEGRLFGGEARDVLKGLMTGEVFDVLLEAERPVDAARLYPDLPARALQLVADYEQMGSVAERMPEAMKPEMEKVYKDGLRDNLAALHAAALADGRTEPAAAVAAELLATLDDAESRMRLVEKTLAIAAARPPQLATWLDEAEAKGADVAELRALLAAPASSAEPAPAGG